MYRRLLSFLLAAAMLFLLACCGKNEENSKKTISVWVLSEDYAECIKWVEKNYCSDMSWKLDISVVDSSEILHTFENTDKFPDVLMLSPESIEPFALKKYIIPLAEAGILFEEGKYYNFAVETGKVSGKNYAMCFHASPGLYAYRRSISKAYLGTDDPAEVEALISDLSSFLDVAQLLKVSSNEETYILAGLSDITRTYFGGDFSNISEDKAGDYFDYIKNLHDNKLIYGAEQWSEAWIQGFNDSKSVFSYFLSGIAVDDVLCRVSSESHGDWAVTVPFSPYSWGGAYLAVCADSSNKNEAAELIKLLTVNEPVMNAAVLYSGIFTANRNVNSSAAASHQFELSVLDGQNYFRTLIRSAEEADEKCRQTSDDAAIISLLNSCAEQYISGKYDRSTAIKTFISSIDSL